MLQLVDMRKERRFLAADPVAIQAVLMADDRFDMAMADDKGLAAAPTDLRTAVCEIWRELLHVIDPCE